MGIKVQGLESIRAALGRFASLARVPEISIEGLPDEEELKIHGLVAGRPGVQAPRDFLKITPELGREMAKAFTKRALKALLPGGGSMATAWQALGEVYLKRIQDRIAFSGADLQSSLAPLKATTIKLKGGNTRLFYHTGKLLAAINRARIVLRFK